MTRTLRCLAVPVTIAAIWYYAFLMVEVGGWLIMARPPEHVDSGGCAASM